MDSALSEKLIDRYTLRKVSELDHYLGIHRGVGIDVSFFEEVVHFIFFSPLANVGDEILEHFKGFTNWSAAGLDCELIGGRVEDDSSCVLILHATQIKRIGEERFLDIPDLIAMDMHLHGASEHCPCPNCGERISSQLCLVNSAHTFLCLECWNDLQARATNGVVKTQQIVQWRNVFPGLLGVAATGAIGWGILQEIELRLGYRFPLLMVALAFTWGGMACDRVTPRAGGVNLALRIWIAASVFVGLSLGNIWGFHAAIVRQIPEIRFSESMRLYFDVQLTENLGAELPYLVCGCVGAWFGFAKLKSVMSPTIR